VISVRCHVSGGLSVLGDDLNIDNRIIAAALVNSAKQFLKLDYLLVILEENRQLVPR
jgi:hypothetical protein